MQEQHNIIRTKGIRPTNYTIDYIQGEVPLILGHYSLGFS